MEWHAESRFGLLVSPIAWRPWRLGGSMTRNQPPSAPRTPRGRFSISHQRKIKNLKKILKNAKEHQSQQLANLVFENLSQKRRSWAIVARKKSHCYPVY